MFTKYASILILLPLLIAGCAQTKVSKEVDSEVAKEEARPMHGGVAAHGLEAIANSKSLNESQRKKLLELHQRIASETFQIQEETSKLKGVLFETIAAIPYNAAKVEEIKGRLTKLNAKKMKNMFDGLKEFQTFIGYIPEKERREFMREFVDAHVHQGGRQ